MKKKNEHPPFVLMILDGFGLSKKTEGNAITELTAPNIFSYMNMFPSSELTAHGKAVGLADTQSGNSEAGHLNIGAGRVVRQDLLHISDSIKDGTFFKNESFHQAVDHAKKKDGAVHLIGLLTDGQSAHASPEHLYALLKYFRQKKQKKVFIHLFTDGRDAPPHGAMKFIHDLKKQMTGSEEIASITGRFYGMDRNKLWKRTEKAYNTLVLGKGKHAVSAEEAIMQAYNRGETDEYVEPTVIVHDNKPIGNIQDGDAVVFFNARSDRARQLAKALVQKSFNKMNPGAFKRKKVVKNVQFVAMSDFGPDFGEMSIAIPSPDVDYSLAKAVGEEYRQLYISETEKYAHVTFFINGGYPAPINGEKRELVSSGDHYSFTSRPQMSSRKITDSIIRHLKKDSYNMIVVNFPNADMLGHTGDVDAAKKGIRYMDMQVHRIVNEVLNKKGTVMITADHGNAEQMIYPKTGEKMTEHTTNPVPCIIISKELKGKKLKNGKLADIAPTILEILSIKKPKQMTGRSLL
jgi:2,3-bisphosphoglycerate-independent phosphoglycerate mutase